MKKELEELCYWKTKGSDNPICGFYCVKCDQRFEKECGEYKIVYNQLKGA